MMHKSLSTLAMVLVAAPLSHSPAGAQTLSAKDVLVKGSAAYSHLSAIHVTAKREESVYQAGRSGVLDSECEISLEGAHRYVARLKQNGQDAIVLSAGDNIWKALASRKQWAQMSAASAASDDDSEVGAAPQRDLQGFLTSTLLHQYLAIARQSDRPEFSHDEDVKLSGAKIPCYVVRSRCGAVEYQLWIDKQRFLVLEYRERGQTSGVQVDRRVKMSAVDINPALRKAIQSVAAAN